MAVVASADGGRVVDNRRRKHNAEFFERSVVESTDLRKTAAFWSRRIRSREKAYNPASNLWVQGGDRKVRRTLERRLEKFEVCLKLWHWEVNMVGGQSESVAGGHLVDIFTITCWNARRVDALTRTRIFSV